MMDFDVPNILKMILLWLHDKYNIEKPILFAYPQIKIDRLMSLI